MKILFFWLFIFKLVWFRKVLPNMLLIILFRVFSSLQICQMYSIFIKICNFRYADDPNRRIGRKTVQSYTKSRRNKQQSRPAHIRNKTKIIIIDLQNNNKPEVKDINNIETVDAFFLGATISSKGGSSLEMERKKPRQDWPKYGKSSHQSDIGQKLGFFGLPIWENVRL